MQAAQVAETKKLLRSADAEHKADNELFFVDKKGTAAKVGRREPWEMKSTNILKANDKIPVLGRQSGGKRARETEAKRVEEMAERIRAGEQVFKKKKKMNKPGLFDLWAEEEQPDFTQQWPVKFKNDPMLLESAVRDDGKFISKTANRRASRLKPEPSKHKAVAVVHPGAAYRPESEAHAALMSKVAAKIVEEDEKKEELKRRLGGKINTRLLYQGPEVGEDDLPREEEEEEEDEDEEQGVKAIGDGGEEEEEEEEEQEGGGGGTRTVLSATGKKVEVGAKLSKTERNKMERHKERERQIQIAKEERKRERQLNRLGELTKEVNKTLGQQEEEAKLREELKDEVYRNKTKRLGRTLVKEDLEAVQLPEEVPATLRKLAPAKTVIKDQFKQFQKRNLIEPRDVRTKSKRGFLAKKKAKNVMQRAFIDF